VFGTYRYVLAVLVAAFHIARWPTWSGPYAVFGFYILSGFLMTSVIHRQYGTHAGGVARYLVNRALRIYPLYWCTLGLSVLLVTTLPGAIVNPWQHTPASTAEWLYNLGIFGLTNDIKHRLVPPAWSLNVELAFYIAMPLLLSRWGVGVLMWLVASLGYTLFIAHQNYAFPDRYTPLVAASVAFSAGAAISRFGDQLPKVPIPVLVAIAAAFVTNACFSDTLWADPLMNGFYFSVGLSTLLVMALKDRAPRGWWARTDRALGRLSYPIFLMHWNVAAIVNAVTGGHLVQGALFAATFVPLNVLGWALSEYVERPVERLRGEVRDAKGPQSDASPLRQRA
jgi:peptidoglycan/LPS O-acetylase OafA/YrhL